mgnify:CR=1 FL=1
MLRQKEKSLTVVLLSALVGLIVGLAAISIKKLIYTVETYAISYFPSYLFFGLPLIGLLLVNFLNQNFFSRMATFKGMQHVIKAIENQQSYINIRLIYSKFITSATTIAFGGSSGMEAAIITSGSSIGSNIGKYFKMNYQLRTLLIGCGTASGISAMYNAPIGGFLFALEVILPKFTPALLIPLLIASATGKILFEMIMGENLRFDTHVTSFSYASFPYIILMGLIGALTAIYMIRCYAFSSKYLSRLHNPYVIALAGGAILGSLIFLFPALYGEGYVSINHLLHGNENLLWENSVLKGPGFQWIHGLVLLSMLFFLRPVSTGLSLSSGGEGGYFAPSLVAGGLAGYLFYKIIFLLYGHLNGLDANMMVFLGMAATFACVMRAPVTAIFLIADTTQSYSLIVPLMIATTIGYVFKNYIDAYNPLLKSGHTTIRMEKFIINQINLREILEPVDSLVSEDFTLRKLIEHFASHHYNIIPVQNEQGKISGVIALNKIREMMKEFENYDTVNARQIMSKEFVVCDLRHLRKMLSDKPAVVNETVILVQNRGTFTGYVSKYKVLNIYNEYLSEPDRLFNK